MNKNNAGLDAWAIGKIEADYSDDVCLLIEHNALNLERDMNIRTFSYYIPATNKANGLARTLIIDGRGYDLFPMSWERIERMADVKEYNTTCLAKVEIIWARSDEDRQRFASLQARLQANLKNPSHMLERAKSWYNTVKEVHQDTLFEEKLYKVRENAGHICDLLAIAVAFANGSYFPHGQTCQLQVLSGMKKLPKDFLKLYRGIMMEESPDIQKRLCHEIIKNTKTFLDSFIVHEKSCEPDFSELAVWYQELCYTWQRVYHWCDEADPVNAYLWCCMLQSEVEEWGRKFGIDDVDILSAFNENDLVGFRKRAEGVELAFRQAIERNGVILDEYATMEDFLAAN